MHGSNINSHAAQRSLKVTFGGAMFSLFALMKTKFDSIEAVVADIRRGRMVIVTDDEDRENEEPWCRR